MSGLDGGGLSAEVWAEQHLWLRDVRLGRGTEVRLYDGDRLVSGTFASQVTASIDAMLAARLAAAEQRAERVTAAVESLADEWERRQGAASYGRYLAGELRAALADPAPREYDDGGPRVREAVERAERDAEVAARAWEEGAFAGREYQKRLLSEWSRIGPTPMHAPNPYRATATEGGDQP